jgi:hypothetical protein
LYWWAIREARLLPTPEASLQPNCKSGVVCYPHNILTEPSA